MKNAGAAYPGKVQLHTRQSVLTRLVMHDAFTAAPLCSSTGMHGLAGAGRHVDPDERDDGVAPACR